MIINTLRSIRIENNWGRVLSLTALVAIAGLGMADPAYAGAFQTFETKITTQTAQASSVARTILFTAAIMSLLIGAAPMLWGQVKVKWLVTGMAACVVFGLIGTIVTAFSGTAPVGGYTDIN